MSSELAADISNLFLADRYENIDDIIFARERDGFALKAKYWLLDGEFPAFTNLRDVCLGDHLVTSGYEISCNLRANIIQIGCTGVALGNIEIVLQDMNDIFPKIIRPPSYPPPLE